MTIAPTSWSAIIAILRRGGVRDRPHHNESDADYWYFDTRHVAMLPGALANETGLRLKRSVREGTFISRLGEIGTLAVARSSPPDRGANREPRS
jgi:hypothetical protein